jgi:hypothetical protein
MHRTLGPFLYRGHMMVLPARRWGDESRWCVWGGVTIHSEYQGYSRK